MYVRAGHPGFARPYEGVHRSTSLMSSSLKVIKFLKPSTPNSSLEEKLKSLGKSPNAAKKKKKKKKKRIVPLSPLVEKLKVKKVNRFVPEESESSVFWDSYAYEHFTYPYICIEHLYIFISWIYYSWSCRIHQLHLCRGIRLPQHVFQI